MMLSVFMTASSARGDDERVVGRFGHLPEIGRRAAPHSGDGSAGAALVNAQPTVYPVDLAAIALRLAHQRTNRVLWDEMVLLLDIAAMHRIRMRRLRGKRLQHSALIGEDVDIVAAPRREIDEPQGRCRARGLIRRVHDGDCDGLLVGHDCLPQCQMTFAPSASASITTSSGAAATPVARRLSSIPRSRNEKLSASTRTPALASLVRSSERAPARAGSTPFCTRNRVTSFFAATSCCARSQQKRTSLESNGSRDSINRYLVIGISLWADSFPLRLGCSTESRRGAIQKPQASVTVIRRERSYCSGRSRPLRRRPPHRVRAGFGTAGLRPDQLAPRPV